MNREKVRKLVEAITYAQKKIAIEEEAKKGARNFGYFCNSAIEEALDALDDLIVAFQDLTEEREEK